MNTPKSQRWLLTDRQRAERNRLHDLWACRRITKAQIERLEHLDRKAKRESEILTAIH